MMFRAALFTMAKNQKQLKYPSADEWISKIFGISILLKYYSGIKKYKLLIQRTTWINLTDTTSKRNQTQKQCILNDEMLFVENASLSVVKKARWWLPGAKGGGKSWRAKEHKETFRVMKLPCNPIVAVVSWVTIRIHQIKYLKEIQYIV